MLRTWSRCAVMAMVIGIVIIALTIMLSRSNNRGFILFGAHRGDFNNFRLYVLDMNTGTIRLLMDDDMPHDEVAASWSPTGAITFMSNRGPNFDIYVWTPTHVRRLTEADQNFVPLWSPDGSRIAFASNFGGVWNLYVMTPRGENVQLLSPFEGSDYGDIAWSPDGVKLAFATYGEAGKDIFIADIASSDVLRVTDSDAEDATPAWSPDGTRLVWSSGDYRTTNILRYDFRTGETVDLSQHNSLNHSPAGSPDGTHIAFLSSRDRSGDQIYVMNADGSEPRNVTNSDAHEYFPSWSPDGTELLFASDRDGRLDLYILYLEDGTTRRLTELGTMDMRWRPQWLP